MSALGGDLAGLEVLDLFAGSGALGLEALSRGARNVVFVERARSALRTLGANVELLGCDEHVRIARGDARTFAEGLDRDAFDVALADPPYGRGYARALVESWIRHGFARELWVEHRSDEDMPPIDGLRSRRYGDTTLTSLTSAHRS